MKNKKKTNNKIIKYILLFSFSFVILTTIQLLFFGNRLDYFWNFNNSLQISNGLLPYRDINIITTPIFHFIVSIFLFIFGKNIVAYASALAILDILFIYICSKITNILIHKKNSDISIYTYSLYTLLIYHFYYEYNFLSCFFILLIIYIELNNKENIKNSILIGILASLSLLSKQSIGLFVILFVLIKPFIFKEEKYFIIHRIIGILIPIITFVLYLLFTNTLSDFISYCITGLREFNNNLSLFEILKINNSISYAIITSLLYIVSFITIIYYLIKYFQKKNTKNESIVLFYAIVCFACAYPIRDLHHVYPGFLAISPLIISFLYKKYSKKIKSININFQLLFKRCFIIFVLSAPIVIANMYLGLYINNNSNEYVMLRSEYKAFNGMVIKRTLKDRMDLMINYEKDLKSKGYDVVFINRDAILYHLPENIYYKDFDLFMRGNFGEKGEERLINEISKKENGAFIINMYDYYEKDKKYNQIPYNVVEYVINNYDLIDQIDVYSVYSNKK